MPEARSIWRTALQPRWLALLGVVLGLCVAFGWLGHWQLDVARSKDQPHRTAGAAAASAPLDQVTAPQQVFTGAMDGRAVTVSGQYDPQRQVLVTGKRQDGVAGSWVVTALRVPSGALVPVVRGFVARPGGSASTDSTSFPVPTGTLTVRGVLQPPEPGDNAAGPGSTTADAGSIPAADTADLVNRWGTPIYNVLVFDSAGAPTAASRPALVPVPPILTDGGGGLGLRNAAYALQWWLFGAFALLLWWRMVRQDVLEDAASVLTAATPDATPDATSDATPASTPTPSPVATPTPTPDPTPTKEPSTP